MRRAYVSSAFVLLALALITSVQVNTALTGRASLQAAARISFACDAVQCQPGDVPDAVVDAVFWSGTSDLTGDGVPEVVQRRDERVRIYQDTRMVYETPPEWRVVDVALGDPNDDGRSEVMLALWRPDADGVEWNQPYIVGYRGGEYRLLWGGRAVLKPIQEIEVGDLDGDGTDELIVLEQHRSGLQSVSVWRWKGWSFGLVWRSPAEYRLHGLVLLPEQTGETQLIIVNADSS